MDGPLYELLYECTLNLKVPGGNGTGFFVGPGLILTGAHVVDRVKDEPDRVTAEYKGNDYVVESIKALDKTYPDLALLRISLTEHPCVYLDSQVRSGETLFAYGYTSKYPGGESVRVEYEGPARIDNQRWLLKFKGGQIIPGYSGSPLLNIYTWNVCGVVKSTRDRYTDLGGGGIPVEVVLKELPELKNLQDMYHNWDGRWLEARKRQIELSATVEPSLPLRAIQVQPTRIQIPTPISELESDELEPQIIVEGLYCPMSIDWYSAERFSLGSRDSYIRVAGLDGQIYLEVSVTAYPSYVAVHNQKILAALCYTNLYLLDLETEDLRSIEVDPHSSTNVVAWSLDGVYLAVGATNTLKIYTSELEIVAEHHVGGKYGAVALTWVADEATLYVGIGNGELWRLSDNFDNPTVIASRSSSLIGLRSSGVDKRIACLWRDGQLEVRKNDEILASMIIRTPDPWTSHGPKLAWCLDHQVLACVTGLTNELIFWQFGKDKALSYYFDRQLLAIDIDPSGNYLMIGLDEKQKQDGQLRMVSTARVSAALATASVPKPIRLEPHLLTAEWSPLLDFVEDKRGDSESEFTLKLDIPALEHHFDNYEESIRKSDADKKILRTLKNRLKEAKRLSEKTLEDLLWMAEQMREKGYQELDIRVACDRMVSFSVNANLGRLGIADYPQIEHLGEFVAFTLGYDQNDLLYMGFEAHDGRGHMAFVPYDFLVNVENLVSVGEALGSKYGVKTIRQKVSAACQLFHEFDYSFGYYEKIELWTKYVLPVSAVRYHREQVIIHPLEVERYGLA